MLTIYCLYRERNLLLMFQEKQKLDAYLRGNFLSGILIPLELSREEQDSPY